jgi:LmbE family N-acetylglucosaminyl deacetylase
VTFAGTVLFVHAHPDDEAILTGGTMAALAAEGCDVILATATNGELGEQPDDLLLPGQTLAHRRMAETRWAADILGVKRVEFLGYRDSGMADTATNADPDAFCNEPVPAVAERVAQLIADTGADVIVGYDPNGGYGHPDHVQVHRVGRAAAALCPQVALFEATMNRDHLRRGVASLRSAGASIDVPDVADDFGTSESAITHAVDVCDLADLKRRAMAAHASQIADTSFFLALPDDAFAQGFGFEWFIRIAGPHDDTPLDRIAHRRPEALDHALHESTTRF